MMLGPGLDCVDLEFLGTPEVIATVLVHGRQGVAVIDPGPSTTLTTLRAALARRGFASADVRAVLLTHIHLDHAGAAGTLLAECPNAVVYVHERGAAHLVDPRKLIASATRLYGDDMDRLWGEIRPVPSDRLRVLSGEPAERLAIVGHDVEWAYTPGHASHHVSYFLPAGRIAFVGDTAGLARPRSRVVLPATPPPDIDLEAWRVSTDRILDWDPEQIVLTHFGPQAAPRVHFGELWRQIGDWSARVRMLLEAPGTDEMRARAFSDAVSRDLARSTTAADALGYERAGRFDFSWNGLARYWRGRAS
ncbi:MAG: MBL fold metallo-hydrolase [Acidobacteria bacterium]|nr:MBL fold metallo-hydrolase [Acidobacteriota bacterium]